MRKLAILFTFVFTLAAQNFTIYVEAMHCPLCTATVRKAILKVEGVKSAKVTLSDKTARVEAGDGVSKKDLVDAVATTGYKGEMK